MTPQEALQLLDAAVSLAPVPRADHIRIVEAVKILQDVIETQGAEDDG